MRDETDWGSGGEKGTYITICRRDANCANHEEPIDPRNIDLTMEDVRCVFHFDLWEV